MNENLNKELEHRHVDESALHAFVHGRLDDEEAGGIENHLERCLACRVWASRLRHASLAEPDDTFVSELVDSSSIVPAGLYRALTASPTSRNPEVGELWRVGRDEALLVWVRRVLDDSALVIPAVFDEDLADNFSLIVQKDDSPLDVELVLLTSVEGHVDLRAFLQLVGSLQVHSEVEALRKARKSQQETPSDISIGSSITTSEDQRLEYRQLVADLLADISPGSFAQEDQPGHPEKGFDVHTFINDLRELTWRRAGVRIQILDLDNLAVDPAHELLVAAVVEDLDASVLATVLSGANPPAMLEEPATAAACGKLLRRYPDADHVAVSVGDEGWTTVIVDPTFANQAVAPPSGIVVEPSVSMIPLPLVDALFKHLDAYVPPWADQGTVEFDHEPFDIASVASTHAGQAIRRLNASGRRSDSPKKEVFVSFDEKEALRVTEFIASIVSGGMSPEEALDELLEGTSE